VVTTGNRVVDARVARRFGGAGAASRSHCVRLSARQCGAGLTDG
jgi:hypothetical protein